MRNARQLASLVGSVFLFWLIAAPAAGAYIDPGSGSFIIQILIGAAAGAGLAIATFWRRIRTFFSRRKDGDSAADAPPTPGDSTPDSTPGTE